MTVALLLVLIVVTVANARHLNRKLNRMSDQQAQLDTDVAALTASVDALNTAVAGIAADEQTLQTEIQALKDQIAGLGAPVDLTGLDAAAAALGTSVQAATDLDANPPPG